MYSDVIYMKIQVNKTNEGVRLLDNGLTYHFSVILLRCKSCASLRHGNHFLGHQRIMYKITLNLWI